MKKFAIALLTAGILGLSGTAVLADDDDDDDDGRRGRWRQRVERSYWYVPREFSPRYDRWDGRYERYYYEEPYDYPPRGRYWSPGGPAPWEYERSRGYRRESYEPYRYRYERPWRWSRGDDDDDDDD